jgi:hypothetical protein
MTLCSFCNYALSSRAPDYEYESYILIHFSGHSFLSAVDEGCWVCRALLRKTPIEWQQELRKRVQMNGPVEEYNHWQKGLVWYTRRDANKSRYGSICLDIHRIPMKEYPSLPRFERPKFPRVWVYPIRAEPTLGNTSYTTNSEESFTTIKAWLDECKKTHTKCRVRRQQADVGWQPTRLVEVTTEPRTSGHADKIRCRLIESASGAIPQDLRYITLSHRWPQNLQGFQRLTVDNLPLWKDCLPTEMLSQTFQDTFWVAYRLGISYVWIDSLCIIQEGDNYADWRKEAPLMCMVYSNAEFNICAAKKSQDGYCGGLFSQREPPSRHSLRLELPKIDGDTREYNNSRHIVILDDIAAVGESWAATTKDSPLTSRGWVFQEQLLSPANVHFADQEVVFECFEMRATESIGSEQDYEERRASRGYDDTHLKEHLPIRDSTGGGLLESSVGRISEVYNYVDYWNDGLPRRDNDEFPHWLNLLQRYTKLELTKHDDRLVALSGVAQYFKNLFSHDDYYIAGLWRSRLASEMLWALERESPRQSWEKREKTHRYFTFSWILVNGPVTSTCTWSVATEPDAIRYLADLEPVKYRTSPEAPEQPFTGEIFSLPLAPTVEIRITGFLRPVHLREIEPPTEAQRKKWPGIIWNQNPPGLVVLLDPLGKRINLNKRPRLDFEMSPSEVAVSNKSGRLYLIWILSRGRTTMWMLLLELLETSDGEEMGRFRRIGILEQTTSTPTDELGEKCFTEMLLEDDFSKLPCRRYDDVSKQHTIYVV